MNSDDVLDRLRRAHSQAEMHGWDFSVLDGRLVAEEPPWDFEADCLEALRDAKRVLDLGTGGGERVLRLRSQLPDGLWPDVTATEGWKPNLPIARENLGEIDVDVVEYDPDAGDALPFDSDSVDLVMCRHETLDASEVARVLGSGGVVLSQQVDARDAQELRDWFGGEPQFPHVRVDVDRDACVRAGLIVDVAEEWSGLMEFADVETLVTYMALVPWDVPDFNVDDHLETLKELAGVSPIQVTQRRYRVHGHKP